METERVIPLTEAELRSEIERAVRAHGVSESDALPTRDRVLDVILRVAREEHRTVTTGEIADALRLKLQTVSNWTNALVREGVILRVRRGHYLPVAE